MGLYWECDVIEDLGYPEYEIGPNGNPVFYDYSAGCEIFCAMFLSNVMQRCPVDTGYLLYSINAKPARTSMRCWTNCSYAQYQEYGTVYMRAQPYFQPSLYAAFDIAVMVWEEEFDNVQNYIEGNINSEDLRQSRSIMRQAAIGLFNSVLGLFTSPIEDAMGGYTPRPGLHEAADFAELIAQYTLASVWLNTGSQIKGTLAGMLVGVAVFLTIAPIFQALGEIEADHRKRVRARQLKEGGYTDILPPVKIT